MRQRHFTLAVLLSFAQIAQAYDEVKIHAITALADKKAIPTTLRLDGAGSRWVLTENGAIQRISDKGTPAIHLAGGKKGLFKKAVDFAFVPTGAMAVADAGLGQILILEPGRSESAPDWKRPRVSSQFAAEKSACVAVSSDLIVSVGYAGEVHIDIFSISGVHLHRLNAPKDMIESVSALAYGRDGTLWALDGKKGKVHRFSSSRKLLGSTDDLESATGLAVDDFGFAYVALEKGRWKEINPEGVITGTFGAKGKAPGQLLSPYGIAVLNGEVLVSERGNRRLQSFTVINKAKQAPTVPGPAAPIQVKLDTVRTEPLEAILYLPSGEELVRRPTGAVELKDKDGKVQATWKKKEKKAPGIAKLGGWALDAAGRIWVSDETEDTLKVVSSSGVVVSTFGKKGKTEGSLHSPSMLAVRPDGSVVVMDKGGDRVQVLGKDGLFLFAVGGQGSKKPGQFGSVSGLAANGQTIALLDEDRKSLLFYGSTGKFMFDVSNKEGKAAYWAQPVALASDSDGRFYVLDAGSRRVRVFNQKGVFLGDFTTNGTGLACGPDGSVTVISPKQTAIYVARFVPDTAQKVKAADEAGNLKVTWEPVGEAVSYNIYKSTGDGRFALAGNARVSPFVDSEVIPAAQYTYAVAGVGAGGHEGGWAMADPVRASRKKDVSLVSIEKVALRPMFSAAYKYYVGQPVGEVTIMNNDEQPFRNVKIALTVARYSDYPTETMVKGLLAGERLSVPVTLTLNDKVLELTENAPVQVSVKVSYFEENAEKSISQNASITLYARNAISWTDKARMSSFITPRDTPIAEFTRAGIHAFMTDLKGSTVGKPLAKAILFYEAVSALGISYVPDPNTPFNVASGKPDMLDYVQFPRETLRRKTGDCDDTTALMASLLESVGVHTAIVDMPGHVLLMANTEESDAQALGLPEERFVSYKNTYWVPIETTQLGKNFMTAWQAGISLVRGAQVKNDVEFLEVDIASNEYPPVTLIEADPNTPPFPVERLKSSFPAVLAKLKKERYDSQLDRVKTAIKSDPANRSLQVELGMVYVEGEKTPEAKGLFEILTKEEEPVEIRAAARNNLGNLAFLGGDFKLAANEYAEAGTLSPDDGGILINRARAALGLGDKEKARGFLVEASKRAKDWREFTDDLPPEIIPK